MVKTLVNLPEEQNNIVMAYMLMFGIDNKGIAVNEIIKKFGDSDSSIKKMLEIKKGGMKSV